MAWFACGKAALTGTDQSTRRSIAKGQVSPFYIDSSGNERLRGVVQLDVVSGRSTEYATGQTIQERLASAGRMLTGSGGQERVYATPPAQTTSTVDLHESAPAITQPAKTFGFPIKTVGIIAAIGIIGYLVLVK